MVKEFNLSEKIVYCPCGSKEDKDKIIYASDVKEFIKRLKKEVSGDIDHKADFVFVEKVIDRQTLLEIIDKLAGDKLI